MQEKVSASALTLGTMNFGKETDLADSMAIVDVYVAAGGNLLDTADCYGDGRAEEMCRPALRRHGSALLVATKTGRPMADDPGGYRPERIRAAVDASLRRLGRDTIDLYQLHQWDPATPITEAVDALAELCRAGKIRTFGYSNLPSWALGQAQAWLAASGRPAATVSQYHYSLACRDIEADVVPFLRAHGQDLMAWSPLGGGVLTGKYRAGGVTPRRGDRPEGKRGYGYERARPFAGDLVQTLVAIAARHGVSPAAVALRWVLDRPAVTSVITGARTTDQLRDNLAAVDLKLEPADRVTLDELSAPAPRYPYDFLEMVLTPPR